MTVTSEVRMVSYTGNGLTRLWAVPFTFYADSHLLVKTKTPPSADFVTQASSTYVVTGAGTNTGSVVFPLLGDALAEGVEVRIERVVPFTQTGIDLNNSSGFDPHAVEREFDLSIMRAQQLRDGDATVPLMELPAWEEGKVLRWSAEDGVLENFDGQTETLRNGDVPFTTVAELQATEVDASVNFVRTAFYSTLGDGGGALYARSASAAQAQSADGSHWLYIPEPRGINVRSFGAKGDGVTNDTLPFQAAWAFYETFPIWAKSNDFMRSLFSTGRRYALYIPGSTNAYVVNAGWKPNSTGGRIVKIEGDGPNSSVVIMPSDGTAEYFVEFSDRSIDGGTDYENPYNSIHISGLRVIGGKGVYANFEDDAAFVQHRVVFKNVEALGFTEMAFGSAWGDDPRWSFEDVIIETTAPNTKGIYLPPGVANPSITNTTITGCRYRVVVAGEFQSSAFISGLTMFSIPGDDHECDIWFQTIDGAETNDGQGVVVTGNRLSNENREGAPIIIIADAATSPAITANHSASTSTRVFRNWSFVGNAITGSGDADSGGGPLVRSYTNGLGRARIADNTMNVAFNYILELLGPASTIDLGTGTELGPNHVYGAGEPPRYCNRPFGLWFNSRGVEVPGPSTPFPNDGGLDPAFELLSRASGGAVASMANVTYTLASGVSATDAIGTANARTVIFTTGDGTSYADFTCDPAELASAGVQAGDNIFVEFEFKAAASQPLAELDFTVIAIGAASRQWNERVHVISSPLWRRVRVPVPLNETPVSIVLRWKASSDSFSGTTDRIIIGRPRIYRANRPQAGFDPALVPSFVKAALPAATLGLLIIVMDDVGGATLAFADGTDWRRVSDRAVIS